MKWTLLYYKGLNKNWSWYYRFPIAPAISDFGLQKKNYTFIEDTPIHPYLQLLYILPYESLNLLPEKMYNCLIDQNINFHLYFPLEYRIDYNYKKYFFDSILHLPDIDIKQFEYLFIKLKIK